MTLGFWERSVQSRAGGEKTAGVRSISGDFPRVKQRELLKENPMGNGSDSDVAQLCIELLL